MAFRSRRRRTTVYSSWGRYVPVAERQERAERAASRAAKQGKAWQSVRPAGRTIGETFWGRAWCDHMEGFQDFSYRLDRGRTYLRSGAVVDLRIDEGRVTAKVQGSTLYDVDVTVRPLPRNRWTDLVAASTGQVGSLLDLLAGRLSDALIGTLTHRERGMFPRRGELEFSCTCPDWASMCKHVAASLLGVGVRLDAAPELLFTLRGVAKEELLAVAGSAEAVEGLMVSGSEDVLAGADLASVFGIELDATATPEPAETPTPTPGEGTTPTPGSGPELRAAARRSGTRGRTAKSPPPAAKVPPPPAKRSRTKAKSGGAMGTGAHKPEPRRRRGPSLLARFERLFASPPRSRRAVPDHLREFDTFGNELEAAFDTDPVDALATGLSAVHLAARAFPDVDGSAQEAYLTASVRWIRRLLGAGERLVNGRLAVAQSLLAALAEDQASFFRELPAIFARIDWTPAERETLGAAATRERERLGAVDGYWYGEVLKSLGPPRTARGRARTGRRSP